MAFSPNTNNILTIQTVQIAPIRTLMTALKDILLETDIIFTKDGVKIINMDKSHTILAYLELYANEFEFFDCQEEKIIIGVNMLHLFKIINTIDNNETLTIYIEKDDYTDGFVQYLGLRFDNGDVRQQKIQKLRLIEPEMEDLSIPPVTFSSVLNLPSSDFQKLIRDLSSLSEKIEIKSIVSSNGAELIFKCKGDFANAEIRRAESDNSMTYRKKQDVGKIIQGQYSLKYLSYFIKCTNLCSHIEMYIENDLPLVVKYDVATLGQIKLCLSPLPSDT